MGEDGLGQLPDKVLPAGGNNGGPLLVAHALWPVAFVQRVEAGGQAVAQEHARPRRWRLRCVRLSGSPGTRTRRPNDRERVYRLLASVRTCRSRRYLQGRGWMR